MNVEHGRAWVARLRDPESRQAVGFLRIGERMCCLGHLCEVSGLGNWKPRSGVRGEWEYQVGTDSSAGILPKAVQDWLGVDDPNPILRAPNGVCLPASVWNDSMNNKTLAEIADLVEATWPELVVQ